MKNHFMKIGSLMLAAASLLTAAFSAVPANASTEPLDLIFVERQDAGEYGYAAYKYVDAQGNEVDLNSSLSTQSAETSGLPTAYDSRETGSITSVKEQGDSGNCWVFSTIGALESDSILKGIDDAETADYSEAHLAWFALRTFTENENDLAYGDGYNHESPYEEGGNWQVVTAALARGSGLAEDSEYPFSSQDLSAMGGYDESERYNSSAGVIIESA